MTDIYFEMNYGKLYESVEDGIATKWRYIGKEGAVSHLFIKRDILIDKEESGLYDIITPYGYGGPVIEEVKTSKNELVAAFNKEFGKYCKEQNIVSEFVRFHPLFNNSEDFSAIYDSDYIRDTVGTNLKDCDDPVQFEFSKRCRKNIRQAVNKGISWRVTKSPDQIDGFIELYYSTMDRNKADDYYYFDIEYFSNCLNWFKDNLLYVEAIFEGKTIAGGLYFVCNKTIHIHLSGTLPEYLYLSPAYILRYAAALWGKENGCEMIHHGGGRSNDRDDSLYVFKKQFGIHTSFKFYVGKKIWNKERYEQLVAITNTTTNSTFFPAYRERK